MSLWAALVSAEQITVQITETLLVFEWTSRLTYLRCEMVNDTLLKYDSYRNRRKGMRNVTKKYGTPGERPCYADVVTEDVTGFGPVYAEQSPVYGHIYVPETQTWLFAEPFKITTLRHKVGDYFCVGIPVLHIEATYTRVNPDVRALVAASIEFGLTIDPAGLHKPNLLNK